MAYPLDAAAQNAVLDSLLGDGAGASMPVSFEVALFNGHPLSGGTELTSAGGYVRPVIANSSVVFPAAVSGQKVSATVDCGTSTGAFSDTVTHYLLIDAADSVTEYFPGRLFEEISVDVAGVPVSVRLACYFNTGSL